MQRNIQTELNFSSTPAGEAREAGREETESLSTANDPESPASTNRLMEAVCERENLKAALRRVRANKAMLNNNLYKLPGGPRRFKCEARGCSSSLDAFCGA